jgi:hypothetical protein
MPWLTIPVLVVVNHFLWFQHFSHSPLPADHPYSSAYTGTYGKGSPYDYSSIKDPFFVAQFPTFTEISAFFGLCVWMVPFALFVSLSASDNVLPSAEIAVGSGGKGVGTGGKKTGMAKMVFGAVKEYFSTSGEALGLWKGGTRHERFE